MSGGGPTLGARRRTARGAGAAAALASAVAAATLGGCDNPLTHMDMENGARVKPYEPSAFFDDGSSSRPLVPGTIARGQLGEDDAFERGVGPDGAPVAAIPLKVDPALVNRGAERYGISCTPCHGLTGNADGMVVQRGYSRPSSFHIDRLRSAPDGYFFQVITSGVGRMPSYATQVEPRDRWAIVAYIRALQLSQNPKPEDVRPEDLAAAAPAGGAETEHRATDAPQRGWLPMEAPRER